MTSGMASIGSTVVHHASDGVRRVYWRAIWLLGSGCLRAWIQAAPEGRGAMTYGASEMERILSLRGEPGLAGDLRDGTY
jgi:hypothetical protein